MPRLTPLLLLSILAPIAHADPAPLGGPFRNLDEACKAYQKAKGEQGDTTSCMWEAKQAPSLARTAANPPAPFRAARFGVFGENPPTETSEGDCLIAVETERGWWLSLPGDQPVDMSCLDKWRKARVAELAFAGTPPRLVVRWTILNGDRVRPREGKTPGIFTSCVSQLRVCGIGAGGAPSCTPLFIVAGVKDCQGSDLFTPPAAKVRWDWRVDAGVDKQGRLVIGGSKQALGHLDDDTAKAVGTHDLVFP